MLWKVYFWSFFCDPTSSDSTIWHRIHRMNFQPRHFDKNNKMLHFRARHDGIFEHKLLDILKNLLLISSFLSKILKHGQYCRSSLLILVICDMIACKDIFNTNKGLFQTPNFVSNVPNPIV